MEFNLVKSFIPTFFVVAVHILLRYLFGCNPGVKIDPLIVCTPSPSGLVIYHWLATLFIIPLLTYWVWLVPREQRRSIIYRFFHTPLLSLWFFLILAFLFSSSLFNLPFIYYSKFFISH